MEKSSSATQLGITDDNISDVVRSLPPRSILLLKNIDACVAQRGGKKKDKKKKGKDDDDKDDEDGDSPQRRKPGANPLASKNSNSISSN